MVNFWWVVNRHYSAVCARQGDGGYGPIDVDRIMVRARVRSHLAALIDRFPELLGGCEIVESAGTDYAYRLFVGKPAWVRVLAALAEDTDFDNFKEAVELHQGSAGTSYQSALHRVWSVMRSLQPPESRTRGR